MAETHETRPGAITARSLMLERFASISPDATLHEARKKLVGLQLDAQIPNALVVVDDEGAYLGILTARLLLRSLFAAERLGGESPEQRVIELARDRSTALVRKAMPPDFPSATPDDRLTTLIAIGGSNWVEYIPVVEDGRPLGLVPITTIFDAAATLALRPDDEGIWVGGKAVR